MKWKHPILAAVALTVLLCWQAEADDHGGLAQPVSQDEVFGPVFTDGIVRDDGQPLFLTRGQSPMGRRDIAARFGWWFTDTDGDLTKIDEYQRVEDTPFWDVDGLASDGYRTFNFTATGTDNEGTDVGLNYFGPRISADFDYQRYFRRLDHDPLDNFLGVFPAAPEFDAPSGGTLASPAPTNRAMLSQDLNAGEEYAIRVQELDARFKGQLTENISWRLNLWGMRKHGERQASNQSHCFNGDTADTATPTVPAVPAGARACHILSQRQRIDWLTMEIEPVVAGHWGPVSVEYSRLMRSFNQSDDLVSRNHTTNNIERSIGAPGDGAIDQDPANTGTVVGYAIVPENFFEIDRLKVGVDLTENTDFYSYLFTGNTRNKHRQTDRRISGFDLRLTNRSIDGLSVTGYGKKYFERNEDAAFNAIDGTEVIPVGADAGTDRLEHPWDREKTTVGLKGRWHPFQRRCSSSGLSLTGGYDYSLMDRAHTEHETEHPDQVFSQPFTIYNTLKAGVDSRWSEAWDTYIRYTRQWIEDPMFASHEPNGVTNSGLPTDVDLVEFGGTWTPAYNILFNATIGIEQRSNVSDKANFDEDDYPLTFTGWWAPTTRWSLSAGYAYFSNWIQQDITLGDQTDRSSLRPSGNYRHFLAPETTRWNYGGRSHVVNAGASYAWTECLTLRGSVEYVRSQDRFDSPSPGTYDLSGDGTFVVTPDWSDLPGFSDVLVETWRLTAGVDYWLSDGVACYFHWNYFDYEDKSVDFNSGTANMFLIGGTAVF